MKYHMIRRISEIDAYLAYEDRLQSHNTSLNRLNFMPKVPPTIASTTSSARRVDEHYGEYNTFRNRLKRFERQASIFNVSEIVDSLYEFLEKDELITDSLVEALTLLSDIDIRALSMILGLRQCYSECFVGDYVDITLNKQNWLRALEVWAFTKGYKEPWSPEKVLPQTHEELVDLYSWLLFILHIPHLFGQTCDPEGDLVYALNQQLLQSKKESEDIKEQLAEKERSYAELQDKAETSAQTLKSRHYADMRRVSAEYNKIVASQSKELQRLRCLLDEKHIEIPEVTADEIQLYQLPEYGVTFVGGSPAMLQRITKQHPSWNIIESNSYPEQYPNNEFCFVNVSAIPHKQFYHIKANCGSVVMCCNCTNVLRIEQELQSTYSKYISGFNNGAEISDVVE